MQEPNQETNLYSALRKEGKSEEQAGRIAAKAVKLKPEEVGQSGISVPKDEPTGRRIF